MYVPNFFLILVKKMSKQGFDLHKILLLKEFKSLTKNMNSRQVLSNQYFCPEIIWVPKIFVFKQMIMTFYEDFCSPLPEGQTEIKYGVEEGMGRQDKPIYQILASYWA